MKSAVPVLLLFVFAACGHNPAPPPSFGFHGRIRPHRDVACVLDAEMSVDHCDAVLTAVDKINAAVGYELLSVPRHTGLDESRAALPERETIYVGVTTLTPGILGVTYPVLYEKDTGYLHLEVIVLDPQIFRDNFMRDSVILHELVHAVGADHAAQQSSWDSVLRPAWQPGAPVELTKADIASLRAAYGT